MVTIDSPTNPEPFSRVDALITATMLRFPGHSERASARYFEAVHQLLAPLARGLESENAQLKLRIAELEDALSRCTR